MASTSVANSSNSTNTTFSLDTTAPTFSNNQTNNTAPKINQNVNFSILINESVMNIEHWIFSYDNGTGTFVNDSAVVIGSKSTYANVTKTIQRANGTTIQWRWFSNNTLGLWGSSTIESFVVANTLPTVTLNEPADGEHLKANGSAGNVLQFNFTVTDPDNATAAIYNCSIMYNSSGGTPNTVIGTNSTMNVSSLNVKTTINSTSALADGRYAWLATCADNGTYSNSSTRTVVIDPDAPDITWNFPKSDNSSRVNITQITLNIQCSDTNIERFNMTVKNSTGIIIASNLTTNITPTSKTIDLNVSLSNYTNQNFTVESSCADDVSGSPKIEGTLSKTETIKDLKKAEDLAKGELQLVFNSSVQKSQDLTIKAMVRTDNKSSATPSDFVLYSSFNAKGTKIKFGLNFTVDKDNSELLLNITSSTSIKDRSAQSGRKGHLVWGDYFTDFNDVPANMTLTVTKINDFNYEVTIKDSGAGWKKGDFIVLDPVTGGLNVQTETTSFVMDTVPPFFTLNITNDTSPTKNEALQFNITITDNSSNVAGFVFSWDNGTGTFTNDSFRPVSGSNATVSVNKTIDRTRGITLQWRWYANDTVDVWNSSAIEQLTVADAATNFTSNSTNNTIPKILEDVQFNITLTDNDNLSGFIFAYDNGTGAFTNDSFRTLNNNVTSATVSVNKTVQRVRGTLITWKWFANDSSGTMNNSANFSLTVANTVPTAPALLNPDNNSNHTVIPINLTYNTSRAQDADNDTITFYVVVNGTTNGTTTGNWSFNATDGDYRWWVIANDGTGNSSNSSTRHFILDDTAPTVNLTSPSNASSFSTQTITFYYNVTDLHEPKNCSIWIEQSNGFLIRSSNSSVNEAVNSSFTRSALENGNHYWMIQCEDNFANIRNSTIRNFTVSLQGGASAGGGGGAGSAVASDQPKSQQVQSPGRLEEATTQELLLHINTPLLGKLFPNYKENVPNNNICDLGESPFIGSGKSDCNFNWKNFTKDGTQYYAWVSRFLVVTIAFVSLGPALFGRRKIEM